MPIVAKAGTYTNPAKTKTLPCPPGFYCVNGIKRACPRNTYGNEYNLTADTCTGTCSADVNQHSNESAMRAMPDTFVNQSKDDGGYECTCRQELSFGFCFQTKVRAVF